MPSRKSRPDWVGSFGSMLPLITTGEHDGVAVGVGAVGVGVALAVGVGVGDEQTSL